MQTSLFDHPAIVRARRVDDLTSAPAESRSVRDNQHGHSADICANNHRGNPLSLEAHASVDSASLRMAIWKHLQKVGAATCDQVERDLNLSHQTCSARFSELKRDGWIFPTGKTQPTRSGRAAMTFVAGIEVR